MNSPYRHNTAASAARLIEAASEPYRLKARQGGVEFNVPEVPEIMLLADRLQLEVVLRNLLSNAFEAVTAADRPSVSPIALATIPSGPASTSRRKMLRRDSWPRAARRSAAFNVSIIQVL